MLPYVWPFGHNILFSNEPPWSTNAILPLGLDDIRKHLDFPFNDYCFHSDNPEVVAYWDTLLRSFPQLWMLMSPPLPNLFLLLNPGLTEAALELFGPKSGLMSWTMPLLLRLILPPLIQLGITVLHNFVGRSFSMWGESHPTQFIFLLKIPSGP